jgi:diguanylate cyclase (GGDEF)-like protein
MPTSGDSQAELPGPGDGTGKIRALFGRRDDPYAGADPERATRLGGGLWIVSALFLAALLPLAPPTAAIGGLGWVIAGAIVVVCLLGAVRSFAWGSRVGWNEMYATSFGAMAMIAMLEWLAGGHATPYHQFYLLCVVYTCCVHPPRRVLAYSAAFVSATAISLTYGGWTANEAGDAGLYVLITLGLGLLGLILMDGVRAQRVTLRSEEAHARQLADTDSLTGLPNRRKLMRDLEAAVAQLAPERPLLLALFDLNGFKAYNDTFGHQAGDTLLTRLARTLGAAVRESGTAYRIGGDEFCVLARVTAGEVYVLLEHAACALSETGEGFDVSAAHGSVLLPRDAVDAAGALSLADQRMYAHKASGRRSASRQTTDVLVSVLSERDPNLGMHLGEVAELCAAVCARLGVPATELAPILQAASLHDVGKAAIPEAILNKPAALTDEEWAFMRRHTLIGERILSAAPALAEAARLVRSSHERFDGEGYPDGLRGDAIPFGSRIIAVCDAYDAMTADRPYRSAMSDEVALDELRRCAGTQFDPLVVQAFCAVLRDPDAVLGARVARSSG